MCFVTNHNKDQENADKKKAEKLNIQLKNEVEDLKFHLTFLAPPPLLHVIEII